MTSNVIPTAFNSFSLPFPWATPAVDALICALDARNVGVPEITRRVKQQFPTLSESAIPYQAVEKRILILDQIVDVDYFKYGLSLSNRSIDSGVGSSKAVKHGIAIHKNTGEPWERAGLVTTKTRASSDSLRSSHSGRGTRLGQAIHKDHEQHWEVLDKMKGLGRENTALESHALGRSRQEQPVPRPVSPARSDDSGRPSAVDHSLHKMRSFEMERPSVENQRRKGRLEPPKMHVSPFPKIPLHQRSTASLRPTAQDIPIASAARDNFLTSKRSEASLRRPHKVLRKKTSSEINRRPIIHIIKPSQESAELGLEHYFPQPLPHAM